MTPSHDAAVLQPGPYAAAHLRDPQARTLALPEVDSAGGAADPLLTQDLIYTLESLLTQAGEASTPSVLKQRLAGLVGSHFPAALAARALALAERYVDLRVALGQLRAPQGLDAVRGLRQALQARQAIRRQFFDGDEYAALFAREDELNRHTLARLEAAHDARWSPAQRAKAMQATDDGLPRERVAQRNTATEHLAVASQTAAFDAQNADIYQRHAARSARYGEAAAHALARLDREEQHWQQRLTLYARARAAPDNDGTLLQQLCQQLFSPQEMQRVDAALALRALQAEAAAPQPPR
ncbi:lipase secretion chaperone [Pantoea sp. 18069]|uniref:lipase secretion chaperone n=1 Tax=Pantoea sp. 18069 TaxID=2681415 RepID=UPI00190F9703|nr:lipase secretion chaperone [Pantoea sp. 18069]